MASSKGSDEIRLLIAPDDGGLGNGFGRLLSLRHPKSGNATCYLLTNGVLQEIHWFKQPYTSWFVGDYVAEDGRLYTATPVDPIFIFLPIFDEARMKKGDDLGKFRQLDEIMLIDEYPGYQLLLSVAENCMQLVCEVKEIGSSKFFRLDDSKVLGWLYHKCYEWRKKCGLCETTQCLENMLRAPLDFYFSDVCRLKQTLLTLDKNYAAQDEKDTLSDAVSILGEYLKDDPWLKQLCSHLRLNLSEVTRKASEIELIPNAAKNNQGSAASREKNKGGNKITRAGRQMKKAKVETESRNIKEMFTRASKRKT